MNYKDLDLLCLDFETHYGAKYTLTSMTYLEYIHDERFYVQGFSYSLNGSTPKWVTADKVEETLRSFDWDNTALLCQNVHFDASILVWKYDIKAAFYLDTMLMGRQVVYGSTSLSSLGKACFPKDKTKWKGKEIVQFKNVKYLDEKQEKVMEGYCNQDIYVTLNVFNALKDIVPEQELRLIDATIKMAYNYNLQVKIDILEDLIDEETARKEKFIETYGETQLRSNQQFAELLEAAGAEVPMKISPTTEKMTYAFSKTDRAFMELLESPNDNIRGLVEARLAVKSNILETRSRRFIYAQETVGYLPIMLNYSGARNTARWSGGQKMNQQNLSRGSKLRHSIVAPPGKVLVVNDLSQIENRKLAWFAGDHDALIRFKKKIDPYKAFGVHLYNLNSVDDVTKAQRQISKAAVLGLGYGMGANKFKLFTKILTGTDISIEEAKDVVSKFRAINHKISGIWQVADDCLASMATDPHFAHKVRGVTFGYKHIMKPNGTFLNYQGLHYRIDSEDPKKNGFVYGGEKNVWKYVYGGLLIENIIQSLSRDVLAEQVLRIEDETGYLPAHMVHDELIYVVDEDKAEWLLAEVQKQMNIPPEWCKDIPLDSDGDIAISYGDAK